MTSHIPIRVFLLSDHRLLRDALARAFKSRADISLVGAQGSSLGISAEIIESACDVLLVDPVNTSALNTEFLDHLQDTLSNLRIVMIDMEAKIADVISAILAWKRTRKVLIEKKKREAGSELKLRKTFGTKSRPAVEELSTVENRKSFSLLGFPARRRNGARLGHGCRIASCSANRGAPTNR